MQQWWSDHPEILAGPVVAPWFVIGLPRSGTTYLQQLLACDAANRSLLFWEAAHPAPPPERATYDSDPRIEAARRGQRVLRLRRARRERHPSGRGDGADRARACSRMSASLESGVINHVPSHVDWCLEADLRPHYRYFRQQLQLLQWRCSSERWALKSPAHLLALDALFETFPDVKVVWIHRDPIAAVTSHCSLVAVLQAIGTERLDLHAMGANGRGCGRRCLSAQWHRGRDSATIGSSTCATTISCAIRSAPLVTSTGDWARSSTSTPRRACGAWLRSNRTSRGVPTCIRPLTSAWTTTSCGAGTRRTHNAFRPAEPSRARFGRRPRAPEVSVGKTILRRSCATQGERPKMPELIPAPLVQRVAITHRTRGSDDRFD